MSVRNATPTSLRGLYAVGVCGALAGLLVGGWSAAIPAGAEFASRAPGLRNARLEPEPGLRPRTDGGLRLADLPRLLTDGFAGRWTASATPGELECLTDAVYYEARGEPAAGQAAVARVVLNRTRDPAFPHRVCDVVFERTAAGCQFSFTCDGAMRRPRDADAWRRSRAVAHLALRGQGAPEVADAVYFRVAAFQPRWGALMRVAQIGAHAFYGLSDRRGAPLRPPAADPPAKSPT